jgi:hypothetical protein
MGMLGAAWSSPKTPTPSASLSRIRLALWVLGPAGSTQPSFPRAVEGPGRGSRRDHGGGLGLRGGSGARLALLPSTGAPAAWPWSRGAAWWSEGSQVALADLEAAARSFMQRYPACSRSRNRSSFSTTAAPVNLGERGQFWNVWRSSGYRVGFPSRERVVFRIADGEAPCSSASIG